MIVTAAELATFRGVAPYTGTALEQAELALELAEGLVKAEIEQAVDEATSTDVELLGTGGKAFLLPELPVTEVAAVAVKATPTADAEPLDYGTDYYKDLGDDGRRGLLYRLGARTWPGPNGLVVVTYTHGYSAGTMPGALKAIVIAIAIRALANPAGLTAETVGRWTGQYGARGFDLTAGDKLALDRFHPGRRA